MPSGWPVFNAWLKAASSSIPRTVRFEIQTTDIDVHNNNIIICSYLIHLIKQEYV